MPGTRCRLAGGMAGHTVEVRGIPTELPPDRVADKLTIHFLRSRNGGGEIADVQVLPGPRACALITFEALAGNGGGPWGPGLCPHPNTSPCPPLPRPGHAEPIQGQERRRCLFFFSPTQWPRGS